MCARICVSNDMHRYFNEYMCGLRQEQRSVFANAALYLQHLTEEMLIHKTETHLLANPNAPRAADPATTAM